jgi:hypothetical protein
MAVADGLSRSTVHEQCDSGKNVYGAECIDHLQDRDVSATKLERNTLRRTFNRVVHGSPTWSQLGLQLRFQLDQVGNPKLGRFRQVGMQIVVRSTICIPTLIPTSLPTCTLFSRYPPSPYLWSGKKLTVI